MHEDYHIERFSLQSYPIMKELFLSAFNSEIDYTSFKKKYNTKRLGSEVIGFLAVHKTSREPAAFYGVFPLQAYLNGKVLLIAQSGDTMTHKNHRKKGLFVDLARITFEECAKKGIAFIFGMPNKNSYHGFISKLHWLHLDNVLGYDLKLKIKTFPLPKFSQKFKSAYLRYARFILKNKVAAGVNKFDNHLLQSGIVRNSDFLDYKAGADKFFLKVDGIVFWIKLTDVLWIGDIDNYENTTSRTIDKLTRVAWLLGYNTIRFYITQDTFPAFLKNFKVYESEPLCYYYLNNNFERYKLLITGADFDTW